MNTRGRAHSVTLHRIHQYLVGSVISSGSFSSIRSAFIPNSKVQFAMKILSKKRLSSNIEGDQIIFNETKLSPLLSHPNIVMVQEIIETQSQVFIVMEKFTENLYHKITSEPLDYKTKIRIIDDICSAVEYLHNNGLCHLDIKLENIFMDSHGKAYLGDFGFTTFADSKIFNQFGSYGYAAPEILEGMPFDGRKADMWSLGVLIYEILTNRKPFSKCDTPDVKNVDFSKLPPEFVPITKSLLSISQDDRMSISELRKESIFKLAPKQIHTPVRDLESPITTTGGYFLEYICHAFGIDHNEAIHQLEQKGSNQVKALYLLAEDKIRETLFGPDVCESFFKSSSLPTDSEMLAAISDIEQQTIISSSPVHRLITLTQKFFIDSGFCVSVSSVGRIMAIHNEPEKDVKLSFSFEASPEGSKIEIESNEIDNEVLDSYVKFASTICY